MRASWAASPASRLSQLTGKVCRPSRTWPVVVPWSPSTAMKSRHAAGSCWTEAATHMTCTPESGPRSRTRVSRPRSTGASSSTTRSTVGSCGPGTSASSSAKPGRSSGRGDWAAASRWSIRSSSRDSRADPPAGPAARWSPPSGLWPDPAWGSHCSHSQRSLDCAEVMAVSTTSAGECSPTSCSTMPRATSSTRPRGPARPNDPAVRSWETIGTPSMLPNRARHCWISAMYSGSVSLLRGSSNLIRDGAVPRPNRSPRKPACSGRWVHSSGPSL